MGELKITIIIIIILLIFGTSIAIARISYLKEASVSDITMIDADDKFREIVPVRLHDDGVNATCWYDGESGLDTPVAITCLPDYMLNRPKDYNPMR